MRISPLLCTMLGSALAVAGCDSETFTILSPPLLIVNVDAVEFGEIPVGFEVSKKVTLANGGEVALTIESLSIENATVFTLPASVASIAPGKEVEVTVRFAPIDVATYEGALVIRSNASNNANKSVPVRGSGVSATRCGECNQPPPASCVTDDDRLTYSNTGTCVMGQCEYTATVEPCAQGCDPATRTCRGAPPPDAGMADVGTPNDSGVADTGVADAGVIDAAPADTGAADAEPVVSDQVFDTPGEHTFVVPAGVTELLVRAWGGGGQGGNQGGATGGGAGFISARVPVTPGETLEVWVAEGGGVSGSNIGNGGGASYLRRATANLMIAGGGGGGGSDGNSGNSMMGGRGGAGGGLTGENGQDGIGTIATYCISVTGGTGASQVAGGTGGTPQGTAQYQCVGQPGARNVGGRATGSTACQTTPGAEQWRGGGGQGNGGGGGGGAGYYGGGGAGFIWTYCAGGGGGGSSYADSTLTSVVHQAGAADVAGLQSQSFGAGTGGARCQGNPQQCVGNQGGNGRVEIAY